MERLMNRPTQASTLGERLKAARAYAGLTQLEVSAAAGVSRAAVALWESNNDQIRTKPSAEQVMAVARICGVPPEMLVDETTAVSSIHLLDPAVARRASVLQGNGGADTEATRRARAFWSTVQLQVIEERPDLTDAFDARVERHGLTLTVPFLAKKTMAFFSVLQDEDKAPYLAREVPRLLLAEAALGKKCDKHLLVLLGRNTPNADGIVIDEDAFGCKLVTFTTWQKATEYLVAL